MYLKTLSVLFYSQLFCIYIGSHLKWFVNGVMDIPHNLKYKGKRYQPRPFSHTPLIYVGIFMFTISSVITYYACLDDIAVVENQLSVANNKILEEKAQYQELMDEYDKLNEKYLSATKTIGDMESKYNELYTEYDEYKNYVGYSAETLYDIANKYMYVIEKVPEESELTLDNLVLIDELAKQYDINPHVITSVFQKESSYNSTIKNANSSATGLGQFLGSTGKFVYSDLLHYSGSYNHSVDARNPELNIKMTFAYIDYLMKSNGGSLWRALYDYNGGSSEYANHVYSITRNKMNTSSVSDDYE